MMVRTARQRLLFWAAILLLTLLAIKGLVVVSQFIGNAALTAKGGSITELVIEHRLPTQHWAGVFGIAVRVMGYTEKQYESLSLGDLEEKNLLFDCMEKNVAHEVYATTIDPALLDLSSLTALNPTALDTRLGIDPTEYDSLTNTFTQAITFQYGTMTITAPGTVTYKINEDPPTTFKMAIVQTTNHTPVFVAIITNFTKGFSNRTYNYQLLLPVPTTGSRQYYFFTDPNDVCNEGEGETPNIGHLYGTVSSTFGMPIPNAIVEVAGIANLSAADGTYHLWAPVGRHNIYAIKTGYKVYQNNVTLVRGNDTIHNIVLIEDSIPNDNTDVGPGVDSVGDQTQVNQPGSEPTENNPPATPAVQQPKVIEGQDFIVSLTELNRRLRIGQFLQERIYIYSFKKGSATVTATLTGDNLTGIVTFDKTSMTIEPNGKGEFVLTIFGVGNVGIYNGSIELGGDINASIPVTIELLPREQLPVEALHIEIDTSEKNYLPNDLVRVTTDMRNMLSDQQYPVRLFYTVQSIDGNQTLWTYETNVFIKTAFSLIKSFQVPAGTKSGDYIVRVTASYLGMNSGTSTVIHVDVPFWQRSLFGLKYWFWVLILAALGAIVGVGFMIKRNVESKKKYHLKVEYDELPKPGARSIFVGKIAETDKTTYFNLENFKTHTIVAGSTGGGKSVAAQVIIEEALDKGVAVIVFDPTAQWTGMLRPCKDKTMLALYPLFGMKKTDAKAFNGNIRQINDAREKIDIKKYVKPGEIQVFACHKLDPKDMDLLVANAIREIFRSNFPENKLLKVLFVFDEVHRLLPKFGGSGDGFLQIERGCREFRKWGLGIVLISQVLSDFVGTIKANINTEIQLRTRDEGDLERIRQKYGEEVLRSLVKATVGTGMVENPAYNRGKPYFVAFKPLRHSVERLIDEEIEQYNSYNDQIDNLFFSLEQLEQEGVDVFDLKLELKLAQDKVKTGNFNMVKIYIEGLVPRIDAQWERLGKQPKVLVRELVNIDDIKSELRKAQEERDKYVATQRAVTTGSATVEKKEFGWKDDVPPSKILNLKNGMIVINLASLYDEILAMKDTDLLKEFDPEPTQEEGKPPKQPLNRFAQWVYETVGDTKLANVLAAAKTKDDLVKTLELKREKKPLPDAKPPQWFLAAISGQSAASGNVTPALGAAQATVMTAAPPSVVPTPSVPVRSSVAALADAPVAPAPLPPTAAPPPLILSTPSQSPVQAAKSTVWIDSLVVPYEFQAFKLENGVALRSLKELREYLPQMDDQLFRNHVGQNYNHFADWIRGVFHEEELASKVASAHSKQELLAALCD